MTEHGSPKDPERPGDDHAEKSVPPSPGPVDSTGPGKHAFKLRGAIEPYRGESFLNTKTVTVIKLNSSPVRCAAAALRRLSK